MTIGIFSASAALADRRADAKAVASSKRVEDERRLLFGDLGDVVGGAHGHPLLADAMTVTDSGQPSCRR